MWHWPTMANRSLTLQLYPFLFSCTFRLPQGSILRPILFSLNVTIKICFRNFQISDAMFTEPFLYVSPPSDNRLSSLINLWFRVPENADLLAESCLSKRSLMEMSNNESILHGSNRIILPSLQERYNNFFLCKLNQTESPFMFNNLIALETSKFYQSHPSLAVRPQYPNMSLDKQQIAEINVLSHALWRSHLSLRWSIS